MVRDAWQTSECDNENVISYLMTMRERFEQMSEVMKENMEKAQQLQKKWYDQNREFQPGDHVLVLLPTTTNKLLAQWQGPYEMNWKIGLIHMYYRYKRGECSMSTWYGCMYVCMF